MKMAEVVLEASVGVSCLTPLIIKFGVTIKAPDAIASASYMVFFYYYFFKIKIKYTNKELTNAITTASVGVSCLTPYINAHKTHSHPNKHHSIYAMGVTYGAFFLIGNSWEKHLFSASSTHKKKMDIVPWLYRQNC